MCHARRYIGIFQNKRRCYNISTTEKTIPSWIDGKRVSEKKFCDYFTDKHDLIYYGGNFFDENGIVTEDNLCKMITKEIRDYIDKDIALQVDKIIRAMKLLKLETEIDKSLSAVRFANGNYCIADKSLKESTGISPNRLTVRYNPDAGKPEKWLSYLSELLCEEDINTVQEFIGYCMLPTTAGQFMLLLIGDGGEGKSIIGHIMCKMFGNSAIRMKISTLVGNRFALSSLENKLVMIDDDMIMSALKDTDLIKEVITNNGKMVMERKNNPFYEGDVYARIIAFANGTLDALYDKSEGFRRRQLVLTVKPKDPDRVDDKMLAEKLEDELEAIALWALEGLHRLIENGYNFTVSEKTIKNLHELRRNDNNIILFLESENYLCFGSDQTSTTAALYNTYQVWCEDNFYEPFKKRTFETNLKKLAPKYGLEPAKVISLNDKELRGYKGVAVRLTPGVKL